MDALFEKSLRYPISQIVGPHGTGKSTLLLGLLKCYAKGFSDLTLHHRSSFLRTSWRNCFDFNFHCYKTKHTKPVQNFPTKVLSHFLPFRKRIGKHFHIDELQIAPRGDAAC